MTSLGRNIRVIANDQSHRQQTQVDDVLVAVGHRAGRDHSCSFPAAMRLPVQVRYPSSTSAPIAPMRNVVSPPSASHMKYVRRADEAGGQTAERVRQRGPLRHGTVSAHPRQRHADNRPEHEGDGESSESATISVVEHGAGNGQHHRAHTGERPCVGRSAGRSSTSARG